MVPLGRAEGRAKTPTLPGASDWRLMDLDMGVGGKAYVHQLIGNMGGEVLLHHVLLCWSLVDSWLATV